MNPDFPSPLPEARLCSGAPLGGRIKERPEDFLVDEQPSYDPSGTGEHIYLGIQKRMVTHQELVAALCAHFRVGEAAIGCAGMKDRVAVARQTVSIHVPGPDPRNLHLRHERIEVLWARRHSNKLRPGHLKGNRFAIRVRGIPATAALEAHRRMSALAASGVPHLFGPQRFGYRSNNHLLGWHLLQRDWSAFLSELLGAGGAAFPERQRARREAFDAGDLATARALCGGGDRADRSALGVLLAGRTPEQAVRSIGRGHLGFLVHSLQAAIFNRIVADRLERGLLAQLVEGDLAFRHANGSAFRVDAAELADPLPPRGDLAGRLHRLEISPSGAMLGHKMTPTEGQVAQWETDAADAFSSSGALIGSGHWGAAGERRPVRIPLRDPQTDGGVDEHGSFVRLAFDLPPGAFGTTVLREVFGDTLVDASALPARDALPQEEADSAQ